MNLKHYKRKRQVYIGPLDIILSTIIILQTIALGVCLFNNAKLKKETKNKLPLELTIVHKVQELSTYSLALQNKFDITEKPEWLSGEANDDKWAAVVEEPEPKTSVKVKMVNASANISNGPFNYNSNVKGVSGLTADAIDKLYAGTPLEGLGYAFKDIEDMYNINAYFSMSVAALESGRGTSERAKETNDYFGMMGTSYSTRDGSIYAFGKLMNSYENKHGVTMTPSGINPRYCETSWWYTEVTELMNEFANRAKKLS